MSNTQRMGRGLEALWGGTEPLKENNSLPTTLDLNTIFPNPNQPRKFFAAEALEELAQSIKEQGIIQPLLVRPMNDGNGYELVAGERRFRAAKIAGLTEVPVYVRNFEDSEVMAAALIENIQRENLSPMEEAFALKNLIEECGITQEELASKLGKSRSTITNSMRLLQLPAAAQEDVQSGILSAGHARAILSLAPNIDAQEKLRLSIISLKLSVRDTEAAALCYKDKSCFPWDETSEDVQDEKILLDEKTNSNRRVKSPYLQELQKEIKNKIELKTSISGDQERGRLTLTYTSTQELNKILQFLGIEVN